MYLVLKIHTHIHTHTPTHTHTHARATADRNKVLLFRETTWITRREPVTNIYGHPEPEGLAGRVAERDCGRFSSLQRDGESVQRVRARNVYKNVYLITQQRR